MQQTVRRFNIITLRPHWGQYIISQGFMCLVSLVLFLVAGHDAITFKMPFLLLGSVTMLMMLSVPQQAPVHHFLRTAHYPARRVPAYQ